VEDDRATATVSASDLLFLPVDFTVRMASGRRPSMRMLEVLTDFSRIHNLKVIGKASSTLRRSAGQRAGMMSPYGPAKQSMLEAPYLIDLRRILDRVTGMDLARAHQRRYRCTNGYSHLLNELSRPRPVVISRPCFQSPGGLLLSSSPWGATKMERIMKIVHHGGSGLIGTKLGPTSSAAIVVKVLAARPGQASHHHA